MTQIKNRPKWPLFTLPILCILGLPLWWMQAFPLVGAVAAAFFGAVALCCGPVWLAISALLFAASCGAGSYLLYGLPVWAGAAAALLTILPGLLCSILARRRLPFFQITQAVGFFSLLLLLVAYGILYLLLGDPIAQLTMGMSESIASMPEDFQTLFFYYTAGFGLTSGQDLDFTKVLLPSQLEALRGELASYVELSYRMGLPTLLVSWSATCAALASYLPLRSLSMAGLVESATPQPDITKIRIPRKVNNAMLLALLVSWIFSLFTNNYYMLAVSQAVWEFNLILYIVQGVSVAEWFLKRKGMQRGSRTLLIALGVLLLRYAMFLIGLLEQMLYFRGIDRPMPKDPDQDTEE